MTAPGLQIKDRLELHVERIPWSGCWVWTGAVDEWGYGRINVSGKNRRAYQVSFETFLGERKGFCVLHKCDVYSCINPDHLYLGTLKDNAQDMVRRGRQNNIAGEYNGNAILTKQDVQEIFHSNEMNVVLARKYGVDRTTIYKIRKSVTWKCLTKFL